MGGTALHTRGLRDEFRRFLRVLTADRVPIDTDRRADLLPVECRQAATDHLLGTWQRRDARGHLSAGERLHQGERPLLSGQRLEDHFLQGLIVLGEDEVAQALANFLLDRCELGAHVIHVLAAHQQLRFQLRIVRAKAELHAAIGRHILQPLQQGIDVRLAQPV